MSIYMWLGTNAPSTGNTIAFYPRIQYRNLVLHRGLWKLNPEYFPKREPNQSDADFFTRVYRWSKQNGLPSRVFVTPDVARETSVQEGDPNRELEPGTTYKPFYVDFESPFSVSVLEAMVRQSARRLVLNEMLPHRDDLWLRHDGHSYVTELVFELTQSSKDGRDDANRQG